MLQMLHGHLFLSQKRGFSCWAEVTKRDRVRGFDTTDGFPWALGGTKSSSHAIHVFGKLLWFVHFVRHSQVRLFMGDSFSASKTPRKRRFLLCLEKNENTLSNGDFAVGYGQAEKRKSRGNVYQTYARAN